MALQQYARKTQEPSSLSSPLQDTDVIVGIIKSAHLNTKHSDMTIICQGKTFPAHKLVVCPRSKYFDRACDGRFKEAGGLIHLDDKDPILIEKVLEFLYKGMYTIPPRLAQGKIPPADSVAGRSAYYFKARLYAEADYFMIDDLKRNILESFRESFLGGYNGSFQVPASLVVDGDTFAETIEEIYSTRADYRELRKVVMENVKGNLYFLRRGSSPMISSKLMKSNPDFTYDLCEVTLTKLLRD
ncbi:hypothetical protein N7507_004123 [Penicillium longicatenatum]|nr:hypothetical protein N7507_004123 [Penicillium longicatenatum]